MAPTPSSRSGKDHLTTPKSTPHSKHRLHFPGGPKTPNTSAFTSTTPGGSGVPTEHPVEVISRIRDHPPDPHHHKPNRPPFSSALDVSQDGRSLRVTTEIGYRDFSLDGVSLAESEDLCGFYAKFIRSRILDVRTGAKCTVMMYGPTGSGKSHTMFGCGKQPGIVYRALKDILTTGEDEEEEEESSSDVVGFFVQVAVLEIYNEEIYDLLSSSSSAGSNPGLPKGTTPKARLEVMGKKAKNASYITGNDAGKISREVAKVEKRRIVKSTLCNDRSSRSHCMIILDVPSVGGRLMLVDMAGSENIEQAGQFGFDAKMQTAKINQGNTALKRVVESIANGDSHVPFRDSKLTMLLQDSFEDDRSKILMILCASPDPKELHKTVSTLEYGAKAKCIVRVAKIAATPRGEKSAGGEGGVLGSRIAAMNQFICKLQTENRAKDKQRDAARKELTQKETEVAQLRAKLKSVEERELAAKEDEINSIVNKKMVFLRFELQKLEEKMSEQQHELQTLRRRLAEAEKASSGDDDQSSSKFLKCFESAEEEETGLRMDQSMELDLGGDLPAVLDVKEVVEETTTTAASSPLKPSGLPSSPAEELPRKFYLSTVFEGTEEEEEEPAEEVEKGVVEENSLRQMASADKSLSRNTRIQNIFRLCGNYREIAHHKRTTAPAKKGEEKDEEKEEEEEEEEEEEVGGFGDKENSRPEGAVGEGGDGKLLNSNGKLELVDSGNCCYLTTNVIM